MGDDTFDLPFKYYLYRTYVNSLRRKLSSKAKLNQTSTCGTNRKEIVLVSMWDNVISSKKYIFGLPVPAVVLLKILEFPKR